MSEKKKRKPALRRSRTGNVRDKINVTAVLDALEQHVLGNNKMTATQVSAALALLKKTLPDISEAVQKAKSEADASKVHEEALQELE